MNCGIIIQFIPLLKNIKLIKDVIQSFLNTVSMFASSVVRFCQVNANELLKYIMTIMNIIEKFKIYFKYILGILILILGITRILGIY